LVFITINLYSFILYILNNFLKTNLEKTITKGCTDKMNPSASDSSIHRCIYRQIFRSVFQTLTDSLTDRLNPSAFDSSYHTYRRIYRQIYSVGISNTHRQLYRRYVAVGKSRYHRQNKNLSVYFKRETFFWRANFVCKTISKWFFFVFPTDIVTKWGITDEGKADGPNPSVKTSVNKSPTKF
jgi:hypothetical protein